MSLMFCRLKAKPTSVVYEPAKNFDIAARPLTLINTLLAAYRSVMMKHGPENKTAVDLFEVLLLDVYVFLIIDKY